MKHADAYAGHYASQDRFRTVGRKISANRYSESPLPSHEGPLGHAAIYQAVVPCEFGRISRYAVLLEVAAGTGANERCADQPTHDGIGLVDGTTSYRQINPVFNHVLQSIGQQQIH